VVAKIDTDGLVAAAAREGCVLELCARMGDFVPRDAPLLRVHGAQTARLADTAKLVVLHDERTHDLDPAFGVRKLVDIVGPSFAREIFYTARQFTAAEAVTMGLINRLVPAADLDATVRQCAQGIAANAPLTVASIKTIVGEILKDDSERDLGLCRKVVKRCFDSEDYVEGRTAFMEKRAPVFKGR